MFETCCNLEEKTQVVGRSSVGSLILRFGFTLFFCFVRKAYFVCGGLLECFSLVVVSGLSSLRFTCSLHVRVQIWAKVFIVHKNFNKILVNYLNSIDCSKD